MPKGFGRFTTPTVPVIITGPDLSGCDVLITFKQGIMSTTFKNPESERLDGKTVYYCEFTQAQSARFSHKRPVRVQANVVDSNGYRARTNIVETKAIENLLEVGRHYG